MKIRNIMLLVSLLFTCFLLPSNRIIAQEDEAFELMPDEVFMKITGLAEKIRANMGKCEESLAKIALAIPRGEYDVIVEEIEKIDEKFSIEAAMTVDEYDQYSSMITPEFIFADQNLHMYAGSLKDVAKENHLEDTLFQFGLVLQSCVDCHYEFAKKRFPSLARSKTDF
ncbi:hypothetical protein KKB99_07525, partial [bacterium]|nr:hypothetical protein [bacterium]MBU1025842.1 hypothetical protein [bacterium]